MWRLESRGTARERIIIIPKKKAKRRRRKSLPALRIREEQQATRGRTHTL